MNNKRIPPAVGEFAVGELDQLLARIAEQAREIERLTDCWQDCRANKEAFANNAISLQNRIAALKAQPSGVVLPEPMKRGDEGGSGEYGAAMIRGYNACLREVARLNSSPVSSAPSQGEQVRDGWQLVPVEPNEAIRDAINLLCDDHSAFEDSDAFWSYLLAAAPSAGSQEQE